MEKKLKVLFDFQRFQKNKRLERLIGTVKTGTATELTSDQLSLVNAAGVPEANAEEGYVIRPK